MKLPAEYEVKNIVIAQDKASGIRFIGYTKDSLVLINMSDSRKRQWVQYPISSFYIIQEKPRLTHQYGAEGSKRWVDSVGRRWNGKTCPECHSKAVYGKKLNRQQNVLKNGNER